MNSQEQLLELVRSTVRDLPPFEGEISDPEMGYMGRGLRLEGYDPELAPPRDKFAVVLYLDNPEGIRTEEVIEQALQAILWHHQDHPRIAPEHRFEGWEHCRRVWSAKVLEPVDFGLLVLEAEEKTERGR